MGLALLRVPFNLIANGLLINPHLAVSRVTLWNPEEDVLDL